MASRREQTSETADIARESSAVAAEALREVRAANDRINRLSMICRAMWSLIREHQAIDEQELIEKVVALDLSDGKLDGKMTLPPKTCEHCARNMKAKDVKCVFCGGITEYRSIFDSL